MLKNEVLAQRLAPSAAPRPSARTGRQRCSRGGRRDQLASPASVDRQRRVAKWRSRVGLGPLRAAGAERQRAGPLRCDSGMRLLLRRRQERPEVSASRRSAGRAGWRKQMAAARHSSAGASPKGERGGGRPPMRRRLRGEQHAWRWRTLKCRITVDAAVAASNCSTLPFLHAQRALASCRTRAPAMGNERRSRGGLQRRARRQAPWLGARSPAGWFWHEGAEISSLSLAVALRARADLQAEPRRSGHRPPGAPPLQRGCSPRSFHSGPYRRATGFGFGARRAGLRRRRGRAAAL